MTNNPFFRWDIFKSSPNDAVLKFQMDKDTALNFMLGMFQQVNNSKLNGVSGEIIMQGFNVAFKDLRDMRKNK